jgi:hypothetical protein
MKALKRTALYLDKVAFKPASVNNKLFIRRKVDESN